MIKDINITRHSIAHIMACAVSRLYPNAIFGFGPAIENGFYYDFKLDFNLQETDLQAIEQKMQEIISENLPFKQEELPIAAAKELFKNQPFKLEAINDLVLREGATTVSVFNVGGFVDLCIGPHIRYTKEVKKESFKIIRVSGAYWKGDNNNEMLQRIVGYAYETAQELKDYEQKLIEIAKRDHRNLGKELDLFSLSNEIGLGLPLFHPKGATVRYLMQNFSQQAHMINGYDWVYTPHIGRGQLWVTSGHLGFYKDGMYNPIEVDGEEYYIKPMNCPFHIEVYQNSPKSYRDLPKRYAEYGQVYRYELSGALQGLTRVRGFTQDDAHIICTPNQVENEIKNALKFSLYILKAFGLKDFKAYIATKPEKKSVGSDEEWAKAIEVLKLAVKECGLDFEIDEGGGAFYGPKIDLKINDVLGREWQCSTIQFDFNMPARFNMTYIGEDGAKHTPYMVHRALFGSIERFMALLIEHYAGAFPLWLAPVQVGIVPVSNIKHADYGKSVLKQLRAKGFRVELLDDNEKLGAKIRKLELEKVPMILVVGDSEMNDNLISVRMRGEGDLGKMTLDDFYKKTDPLLEAGKPQYQGLDE
jgi:threonyl-tRNA synthetase